MQKRDWLKGTLCLNVFNLSSQHRLSFVIVAFDFNDSLNDVAPVSPIPLPVDVIRKEKSELLMDAYYVSSFVFTNQIEFNECCV